MAESQATFPKLGPLVSGLWLGLCGLLVGSVLTVAVVVAFLLENVLVIWDPALVATIMITCQAVGFAVTAGVYLLYRGRGLAYVRLRLPAPRNAALGIGGLLALLAAIVGVNVALGVLGVGRAVDHGLVGYGRLAPDVLLLFAGLSVLVIAPAEELLFRGVIQTRQVDAYGIEAGVAVASLVFALAHLPVYGVVTHPTVILALFALGVVFGLVYEATDNLLTPIVVHGVYNAGLFLALYASAA